MVPLSLPPTPLTDTQQLIAKALGLKAYRSVSDQITPSAPPKDVDLGPALQEQYQAFEDLAPIELLPTSSEGEVETVIRAVYRQVLGNAHVMESERLSVPESQLKRGEISVREFVRQVAKSTLYRSRFFDNCPRYRSMELNFKHLLGRAPDDYSETFSHSQILDTEGFEAEIDSYLDSDEYQDAFGENIVPYYRGYRTQTGKKLLGFTNTFKLYKSLSTSDKAGVEGNQSRLAKPLMYNNPSGVAYVKDVQQLIAEALQPKPWMVRKPVEEVELPEADSALQQKYREQEALIETLHKQLAELRPSAAFGEQTLSKWQSVEVAPPVEPTYSSPLDRLFIEESPQPPSESLEQRVQEQAQEIADLEAKIADSRRWAGYGETQLNKWQRRSFSIR
ncbi:MAG: phycobilisome Linker polypeptide [Symploca sp. SIO1A3]|nr:phycobilisome Linker polypeptide [Symploca sp. SIO1A3]